MGLARFALTLLFPLLSIYAIFAIQIFSKENGTVGLIEAFGKDKVFPSAGGPGTLRTTYTGIEAIDKILIILNVFVAPVVDGTFPSLTLHSIAFSGAFGSAWVLVVLESWRAGSSKFFSFPSIFGIGAQILTYAVCTPLYLFLQLARSDVSFQPTAKNIAVPTSVAKAIPAVFILAYTVPSLGMMLPAPGTVTFDQKQILMGLWHPWPAYVSLLLTIVSLTSSSATTTTPSQLRKSLRGAYTFALSHAALNHIVSWSISLATIAYPAFFRTEYLTSLHPAQVFVPRSPFASSSSSSNPFSVQSLGEGVHYFLQWDNIIGSSAVLLWAVIANVSAQRKVPGEEINWVSYVFKIAHSLVLTGPVGAAVRLVWERDELVLEEEILKNASKKAA